jgi:hypothetical protein
MSGTPRHLRARDDRGAEVRLSEKAERGPGRLSSGAVVAVLILGACVVGGIFAGPAIVVLAAPWAAAVLLAEFQFLGPRRMAREAIESSLRARRCPVCLYSLEGLGAAADGCVQCPECGAAWRFPGPAGPSATLP